MQPRSLVLLFTLHLALAAGGCDEGEVEPAAGSVPGLVVVVSVDQLMPEQLERYDAAWEGGFRRLLDGGQVFTDAVHDHAITYTSPGHASLVTGVVPARHGIVANSWQERRDGEWESVPSVSDPRTEVVGGGGEGRSPHRLLADALPDWIAAAHPDARVVSLSGKHTAAVLLAGRAPGHVYWFSPGERAFVTSDHYRAELPAWVTSVNRQLAAPLAEAERCWESGVPAELHDLSRRDTVAYEADGLSAHFPHCADDPRFRHEGHFMSRTPFLDRATLELAREAVDALEPGRRGVPDYLAVGLSTTDRVGHDFGPWSREQLDNLIRADRELGEFLEFLDRELGPDGYLLALSSDHGVLPLPEYLGELGEPGRRLTSELRDELERAAEGLEDGGAEARRRLAEGLEEVEWVEQAMPLELLASEAPADSFVTLYRNSFHPERLTSTMARYGVEVRLSEGTLVRASGTTHGEPYLHDRRVPLILYGREIPAGARDEAVRTVDLAPTLAALLGVEAPGGVDGEDLGTAVP